MGVIGGGWSAGKTYQHSPLAVLRGYKLNMPKPKRRKKEKNVLAFVRG
jgi:hypothetical protein